MSNNFDPLEQELAKLKPREPSTELRQRTYRKLAGGELANTHDLVPPVTRSFHRSPTPPTVTIPDESQPTLQTYRRAIDNSPEEFDALLSKQASTGGESTSFHAFSRSELNSLGEP